MYANNVCQFGGNAFICLYSAHYGSELEKRNIRGSCRWREDEGWCGGD